MRTRVALAALVLAVASAPSCTSRNAAPAAPAVDVSAVDPAALARVERLDGALRVTWPAGGGRDAQITLSLRAGAPLVSSLAIAPAPGAAPRVVASALTPRYELAVGSRAGTGYVFFDAPGTRPYTRTRAALDPSRVRVEAHGGRATVTLSTLSAGAFRGDLALHVYAGSPLVHFEAAMAQPDPGVAYYFDAGLDGDFSGAAYVAPQPPGPGPDADVVVRADPRAPRAPLAVRYRAIAVEPRARDAGGALVLFPAPHAFFFARDLSTNLGFAELGGGTAGIRQAPDGGGAYAPWYDAPPGSVQRMDLFVLVDPGRAEDALARVRAYTHGDAFVPIPGRVTFTSHWHSRLTASEEAGAPNAPELVRVLKRLGVNILHLAEFHFDAHWNDPGALRLDDQRLLFDITRRWSDAELLLIPGEEGVQYLGNPAPGDEPGHWMLLLPKPVYFTWARAPGAPFRETIAPYGTVYHLGSRADAYAMLGAEGGLAWTAHPRIKASAHAPDAYKTQDFFLDDRWLGATWKAMPSDLSMPHLGERSLALHDDMRGAWGLDKRMLGEVDVFEVDQSHELYAHANVNYLKLASVPSIDDWSSVLGVLRRGEFFTTTGEVLVHDFTPRADGVHADLEWTLPLDHARVVWSRAGVVSSAVVPLDTQENGRATFDWPIDLRGADWARLDAWDVARDGAFTQAVPPS